MCVFVIFFVPSASRKNREIGGYENSVYSSPAYENLLTLIVFALNRDEKEEGKKNFVRAAPEKRGKNKLLVRIVNQITFFCGLEQIELGLTVFFPLSLSLYLSFIAVSFNERMQKGDSGHV